MTDADHLERVADRLDASNQGVRDSLVVLGEILEDDQANRRFWRWVIVVGMAVNFGVLSLLGWNSVQGSHAREKLLQQNRVAQQTLQKVDAATNSDARAEQAKGLAVVLLTVKCDNQRNIQRAMVQLGAPYELSGDCK